MRVTKKDDYHYLYIHVKYQLETIQTERKRDSENELFAGRTK